MSGKVRDLSLTGECEMCGAPNGVLIYDNGYVSDHHCPTCARKSALYDAAYAQLDLLIEQAVKAWLTIWEDERLVLDLEAQFSHIGVKMAENLGITRRLAEDVQPVPLAEAAD